MLQASASGLTTAIKNCRSGFSWSIRPRVREPAALKTIALRSLLLPPWISREDRLLVPLFRWRTGRSIHAYTPFDVKMRTFISRRNVNLPLFTLALIADAIVGGRTLAGLALYFVVLWQAASFLFHAERVAQFWNARK